MQVVYSVDSKVDYLATVLKQKVTFRNLGFPTRCTIESPIRNLYVVLLLEPGPGGIMVGNLLRGTRIGEASGREIGEISETEKRVRQTIMSSQPISYNSCISYFN